MRRRYLVGQLPSWAIPETGDEYAIEVDMTDDGTIVAASLRYRDPTWSDRWSAPIPLAIVMHLNPRSR
jgi:hypothetical protein